ncbi:MAG: hypothetical protein WAM82_26280 [Thermoanaerobaculia bacterium]
MSRVLVLALATVALLSALPASAAPQPAVPAATACPQPVTLFDIVAPEPEAAPALPAWLDDSTGVSTVFRGYCACECSTIRDCNTNADCSNHRCLKAISCC